MPQSPSCGGLLFITPELTLAAEPLPAPKLTQDAGLLKPLLKAAEQLIK